VRCVRHAARSGASINPVTWADRDTFVVAGHERIAFDETGHRGRTAPAQSDRDRRSSSVRSDHTRQFLSIDVERNPIRIMASEHIVEGGIEQRLEMSADGRIEITRVEERRQRASYRGCVSVPRGRERHAE